MECTVQETTFTLMKESRTGNCAIVNNSTKKLLNWKLRLLLQSMVLMINTIRLKFIMMKLNHLKNLSNLINLFCIQIKVIYSSTRAQNKKIIVLWLAPIIPSLISSVIRKISLLLIEMVIMSGCTCVYLKFYEKKLTKK